jgi:hypothetical protein
VEAPPTQPIFYDSERLDILTIRPSRAGSLCSVLLEAYCSSPFLPVLIYNHQRQLGLYRFTTEVYSSLTTDFFAIMDNVEDRMRLLFHNVEGPNTVGYGLSRRDESAGQLPIQTIPESATGTNPNPRSSKSDSSGSRSSYSSCFDSVSSAGTSTSSAPPVNNPVPGAFLAVNTTHNLPLRRIVSTRDLPCECTFAGCYVRFHIEDVEDWIRHSISHFGAFGPPKFGICTFCDTAKFDNMIDPHANWTDRMMHIRDHFVDGPREGHPRPDFHLIKYLYAHRLMSKDDFEQGMGYTERPQCDNLVPHGYQTDEMKKRYERSLEGRHDLNREKREMRKVSKQPRKGKVIFKDKTPCIQGIHQVACT